MITNLFLHRDNKDWIYSNEMEWPRKYEYNYDELIAEGDQFDRELWERDCADWLSTATFVEVFPGEVIRFKNYIANHVLEDYRLIEEKAKEGIVIPKCFEIDYDEDAFGIINATNEPYAFFVSPSKLQDSNYHEIEGNKNPPTTLTVSENILHDKDHCPTCGAEVKIISSDEGTNYYEPVEETQEELWKKVIDIIDLNNGKSEGYATIIRELKEAGLIISKDKK